MALFFLLCGIYLLAVLLILPIWTIKNIGALQRLQEQLKREIGILEHEIRTLRRDKSKGPDQAFVPQAKQMEAPEVAPIAASIQVHPLPVATAEPLPGPPPLPIAEPPEVLGNEWVFSDSESAVSALERPWILPGTPSLIASVPPEVPPAPQRVATAPQPPEPAWVDTINWEQFMGAKLFAWLGGLALFLAVSFFVKYSFEHDLIPAAVRVAIGFVIGAGLVVGGLKIPRQKYAVTAQTLIAVGIVSLYAVTFSCRSIYHFEFFGPVPTFLLMALITATAFILAVRLDAQVIAILGILGGFLTPLLLSTGVDNPVALFGYIAVLDIGLISVALHRRWFYLVALGATGTVLMIVGWAGKFYAPEKTVVAMAVCLGFCALFLAAVEAGRRLSRPSPLLGRAAVALLAVAFCFAIYFLGYPDIAARTGLFFGYVILVSLFVFVLAWCEGMGELVVGVAGVTALLIVRWADKTFRPEQAPTVVGVCLGFCAIYFVVYLLARRWQRATPPVLWAAVGLPGVALAFAFFLMNHQAVGATPGLLFLFILASDGLLLALAWLDERLPKLHLAAGFAVFALLSIWTAEHLTAELLPWALAMYLVFAALHTVFPLVLERKRPAASPTWWSQMFPPLALLLMLMPLFKLEAVSFLLWPAILLVDLIAVGLALLSASMLAVATVLVLTLAATGLSIFRVPVTAGIDFSLLLIIGGFAVFFFAASLWLARKLGSKVAAADRQLSAIFGDPRSQLPAFASLLPFLLLIMACARLSVPDPSAVFGLGLLLVVLTLGLTRILLRDGQNGRGEWLPACALAGVAALELMWHTSHFDHASAGAPLVWYAGFYAVFAIFPFLFRRQFTSLTGPWAVAAMSGLAHFWIVYQAIKIGWPISNQFLGLVPAIFSLAPLVSLVVILRTVSEDNSKRLNHLAWFGGVALFFITLIFPIQFDRQWLTVAWALEGAALLWLFHRVPHPALRVTGVVLLVISFVRLAMNPEVLGYHVRSDIAILNWYLYAYGIAAAVLFAGARLLAPPRQNVMGINTPPILNALGVILAFLLLNLEIADYFTAPGTLALAFDFSGNFACDMSYTIGWALFAFVLLIGGIWQRTKSARYAALVLLSIALLKLFFRDLAQLESLYLIGALFAVAVIAILFAFAYQRFLPNNETPKS